MTAERPARRPRAPRRISPQYLERAALHYLQRYASSAENLRRVLRRKVARATRADGSDPGPAEAWIDALVERYLKSGLLNDATYAEGRARSLLRQGRPSRTISAALAAKGVAPAAVAKAVAEAVNEAGGGSRAEMAAAIAYARKRRLGPWRAAAARDEYRDRDLATLARRGFDCDTARRVVEALDPDAFLEETAERDT